MKININNFKNVIVKATMNFGIETLQLRFSDRIKSDMLSSTGTSISIMNLENNVLDTDEELVLNFTDPNSNVIPFISLFDNEEIDISLTDAFMTLKHESQITKIRTSHEDAIRRLGADRVQNVDWFYELPINENFIRKFNKIKKIGSRFGKVYFIINNNELFIETSDRTNIYSNGVKFKLANIQMDDISLDYIYNDMVNFFHCIDMNIEKNFTLKLSYDNEQGLGCIYAESENSDEKYSLISRDNI